MSLLGPVAMATVHTLRLGEGLEYANQALPSASPTHPGCVSVVQESGFVNAVGPWRRMQKWWGLSASQPCAPPQVGDELACEEREELDVLNWMGPQGPPTDPPHKHSSKGNRLLRDPGRPPTIRINLES